MFTFKNKKTFQFANNNNKFNISRFASLEIKEIFIFPNYIIINVPGGRAYIQNDHELVVECKKVKKRKKNPGKNSKTKVLTYLENNLFKSVSC